VQVRVEQQATVQRRRSSEVKSSKWL